MGAAGLTACHYSARHQQRVTKLVFVATRESDANRQLLHLRQGSPEVEAELRGGLLGGMTTTGMPWHLPMWRPSPQAAWERLLLRGSLLTIAGRVSPPVLYVEAASD